MNVTLQLAIANTRDDGLFECNEYMCAASVLQLIKHGTPNYMRVANALHSDDGGQYSHSLNENKLHLLP